MDVVPGVVKADGTLEKKKIQVCTGDAARTEVIPLAAKLERIMKAVAEGKLEFVKGWWEIAGKRLSQYGASFSSNLAQGDLVAAILTEEGTELAARELDATRPYQENQECPSGHAAHFTV